MLYAISPDAPPYLSAAASYARAALSLASKLPKKILSPLAPSVKCASHRVVQGGRVTPKNPKGRESAACSAAAAAAAERAASDAAKVTSW